MNETDQYILESINIWVWSGFYNPDRVQEMIDDILEDDANEDLVRAAVNLEFKAKEAAEATWPSQTDCDRLDAAFEALSANGIIALQNAGFTMSDGRDDVGDVLSTRVRSEIKGYCFYHGQDVERAVHGDGLWLAFGDRDADPHQKTEIGKRIRSILESYGFEVEWNGDPETRLCIPRLDWKRRSAR
jgi:hypothetical protein